MGYGNHIKGEQKTYFREDYGNISRTGEEEGQVWYVDFNNGSSSNGGYSWADPFDSINTAMDAVTTGKGDRILIKRGFYLLDEQQVVDKNDVQIWGCGNPEATMLFGSGSASSVTASNYDLIKITGNNCLIDGLGLFTYKNTKSAIVFDDTGGANTASFNEIRNCLFSPQAADGQLYGIKFLGGNANYIHHNRFEALKEAGIYMNSQTGNPVRNIIQDNDFVGCDYALSIVCANYETLFDRNIIRPGSQSGYGTTKGIIISSGMTAGDLTYSNNIFNIAAADVISDSKAGGTVNAAAKLNNYYLA